MQDRPPKPRPSRRRRTPRERLHGLFAAAAVLLVLGGGIHGVSLVESNPGGAAFGVAVLVAGALVMQAVIVAYGVQLGLKVAESDRTRGTEW